MCVEGDAACFPFVFIKHLPCRVLSVPLAAELLQRLVADVRRRYPQIERNRVEGYANDDMHHQEDYPAQFVSNRRIR